MNDDLLLLAERERAARARVSLAAQDLRSALAPSVLTRRAVRARPWAALAVAGAGGAVIGSWLAGSRPAPATAATAATGPTAEPKRSAGDWLKLLVQVGQVVGTVAAAKNAAAAAESSPAHV